MKLFIRNFLVVVVLIFALIVFNYMSVKAVPKPPPPPCTKDDDCPDSPWTCSSGVCIAGKCTLVLDCVPPAVCDVNIPGCVTP
jgi:hypothetical protein